MVFEIDTGIEIGTIAFTENLSEDNIGRIDFGGKLGQCKVIVHTKEGQVPHFHLKSKGKDRVCVCIYSNQYFQHGKNDGSLNSSQRQELDEWMSKPYIDKDHPEEEDKDYTNWVKTKEVWEENNPKCLFPKESKVAKQPDYSTMDSTYNENLAK